MQKDAFSCKFLLVLRCMHPVNRGGRLYAYVLSRVKSVHICLSYPKNRPIRA